MEDRKKWGTIMASVGGLLVVLNLTFWKDSEYALILALVAAGLAVVGAMMSLGKKKTAEDEQEANE